MKTIDICQPTFTDFYALYPRKKSRADAEKAWGQALKKGTSPDEIMEGLRRNLECLNRREAQFRPYPASWLRAGGWDDEPDAAPTQTKRRSILDAARDQIGNSNNDHWFRSVQH